MKLVSFRTRDQDSWGIVSGRGIVDAGARLRETCPTLRAALERNLRGVLGELDRGEADFLLTEVTLLPPVTNPDKIVCIGLNYRAHAAEAGFELPEFPQTFFRISNTLVAHEGALVRPTLSGDMDYEGELAVIMGRGGRHIPRSDALSYVAGYSCFNDGSLRDYQFKHSLSVGKNFVRTGGFGPWIATADEIPDPSRLELRTRVNGREVQHGSTSDLIFTVPELIEYVSSFTPLVAGDIIATGTPAGVGFKRNPPLWLKDGDTVEVEITSIGTLRNYVADEIV